MYSITSTGLPSATALSSRSMASASASGAASARPAERLGGGGRGRGARRSLLRRVVPVGVGWQVCELVQKVIAF